MSACDATICPIGAASGGEPTSSRTLITSARTSSSRSPAACARSCWSSAATSADGQLLLRGAHRDARRKRRNRLVADVLVDQVGGCPELVHVDAGRKTESGERLCGRLGGNAMHRQCDRIHRRREDVGACTRGLDRRCERVASRALRVEPDRQPRDLAQLGDELARTVRLQERGRVVEEQPCRAELGQALRGVDQCLVATAAVQQSRLELALRGNDRLGRLAQVVDVVQRIVKPEDADPALRR